MDEKIMSLSDDEKIEELGKLNDDRHKFAIIRTIQDEDKKVEALEKLSVDNYKVAIIKTLQDENKKIEQLEKFSEDKYKLNIIQTIQDEDKKIEALEKISDDIWKVMIIEELQDEDKKIEALEKLSDEYKVDVIQDLQDEEKKIEALEKISDDIYKAEVIETIQDDEKKIEQLEKLSADFAKAEVIATLKDEEKKIEQLERISVDFAKAGVIATLQDEDKIIKELKKLSDDFVKAIIFATLQNDNSKQLPKNLLEKNGIYTEIGLDPKMTIGMEVESEGIMSSNIKALEKVIKGQFGKEEKGWGAKFDGSLRRGVELVSPILTDNKQDVEDIYMVCSMLQKCGQIASGRCGGHIHIGADFLKSKEAYVNLFEIWGNSEKVICKMSNEIGTIPRMGLQEYASPISPKLNEAIERETINLESEENLEQFISEIQEVQENRYSGLNLLNINNGKNTIEFRMSNGTINPDTWIENARLYGRIIEISQKLSEIEKQPEQSKEEERLLDLQAQLKEEIPEQEKMEILLELLFSEEERKVYRERYISSSKLLEQMPDEKNPLQGAKYSRVDFKKKKHSLDEFYNVAVNDRINDTNEVTRETLQSVRTEDELEQVNKSMEV